MVATISDTMTGAALAAGPTGYSVAVTDRHTSTLLYFESATCDRWPVPDPVWGSGTGGWYPSVALDPVYVNEPSIAFYVCSPRSGIVETSCLQSEDSLRVSTRLEGVWRETLVDPAGGWAPKLGFLPNGKRVVVYRVPAAKYPLGPVNPQAGALKIAIEH